MKIFQVICIIGDSYLNFQHLSSLNSPSKQILKLSGDENNPRDFRDCIQLVNVFLQSNKFHLHRYEIHS